MDEINIYVTIGLALYLGFSFCSAILVIAASMLSSMISNDRERWLR